MDGEELAFEADIFALPEFTDHLDRLLQHLVPNMDRRPSLADDMLVEILSSAKAEHEAAIAHQRDRRRHLRHDGGMVTNDRAGDHRHQLHTTRPAGNRSQNAPRKWALALLLEPGMEVV